MTIIVAVKDESEKCVWLGCDSQCTAGHDKRIRKDKKIFKRHGDYYGFCGSYRMGQLLQYHTPKVVRNVSDNSHKFVVTSMIPVWRELLGHGGYTYVENNREEAGKFIFIHQGEIFSIDSDFQVGHYCSDYEAIGSGEAYALGSLYATKDREQPKDRVKSALEAACEFDTTCGGKLHIMKCTY